MKKLIVLFTIFACVIEAKTPYYADIDFNYSPYCGSENILSFYQTFQFLENKFIKVPQEKTVMYTLTRFAEIAFVWGPLSEVLNVLQHEVFGHGYRIRDINKGRVNVSKYKIGAPSPYGQSGGETSYKYTTQLTSFQEMAIAVAGVEATSILANRLKMKWLYDRKIEARKATLYIDSMQDLTFYVFSIQDQDYHINDGHDINGYLYWLNNTYFEARSLSKDKLKKSVLINFLDPITYYSIASLFYYAFTGKDFNLYMFKIKDTFFLPNLRLSLTPYGIEYNLETFLSHKNRPIFTYVKYGNFNNNFFVGTGIEYLNIFKTNSYSLGGRLDLFYQPKIYSKAGLTVEQGLQIGYSQQDLKKNIFGVSSYVIFEKRFSKTSKLSFFSELGYKSKGFVPGQSLRASPVIRIGVGFGSF